MLTPVRSAALLLGLLVAAGCSPSAAPSDQPFVPNGPAAAPQLPFPAEREASGLTEYVLDGTATELRSAGAQDNGTALVLDASGASPLEYGVYRFNPGSEPPDSVSVLFDQPVPAGAFIGLANYTTLRWEFHPTSAAQKSFTIDSGDYLSPLGNIWVAVFAAGSSATVNALSVRTIRPGNQPPVAQFDSTPGAPSDPPLTVDFSATGSADPDGQVIEYAWDWEGDGLYDGFSDSPLATHTFPAAAVYSVTLRVTDDQFARDTFSLGVASGNLPPIAGLGISPGTNLPPSTPVTLSGATSSDPDGSIVSYEWDGDGNPGYEFNSGAVASYSGIYSPGVPGARTVRLRVTDDDGASSETSLVLESQGWTFQPVGAIATGAQDTPSLAVVDGRPAIAYAISSSMPMPPPMGGDQGTLYYTIATDEHATAWEPPVVLSDAGFIRDLALLVCDGRPCVAYSVDIDKDWINQDMQVRFCRAMDVAGTAWHAPLLVDDSSSGVGEYLAAAVVAGQPGIACMDMFDTSLYYSAATNAAGTAWSPRVAVDTAGGTGYYPSLADINGLPAVAYYTPAPGLLRFARGLDSAGSSWSVPLTVDDNGGGGGTGEFPSLAEVNARPAIAYFNTTGQELAYIRALDGTGAGWPASPVVVDTNGTTGVSPCMAVIGGVPAISYSLDAPDYDFLYVAASNADGGSWGMPETVASVDFVGYWSSLAQLDDQPVVSYYNLTFGEVNFARRY